MNTKLTLTVEQSVIKKAKLYAKSKGRSLSDIIENYLRVITMNNNKVKLTEITPVVKSLLGSFKIPDDVDYKEGLTKALEEKYL